MTAAASPQELVERALAASTTDGCIAIADRTASTNLRWANNTLTTNGVSEALELTVIATVSSDDGVRAATVSRSCSDVASVTELVAQAETAARESVPADDAAELLGGGAAPDWDAPPEDAPIGAFTDLAAWLGETFGAAKAADQGRYGYAEHTVDTTYLGSSTGLRLRHAQPAVRVELTGRTADGGGSAWAGHSGADLSGIDLAGMEADLVRRLQWSEHQISLNAGRYDTILPPSAVADLMICLYWHAGALSAHEGQSAFARPGGGTRIGERLSDVPLTLRSDPRLIRQQAEPFVVCRASSRMSSVFDNGAPVEPTAWIRDGTLAALIQTRHSARRTGLPFTPFGDNLELSSASPETNVDEMVGSMRRGLLLTCLWYIRPVDPQTLLLTGLTRDGVFVVEGGEVVGAANNFRFNESPVAMLRRVQQASAPEDTLAREFGDYFTRTKMAALQVADFNMSSVSQAS